MAKINQIEVDGVNYEVEDENAVHTESDPTIPTYVKNISESDITNWNNVNDIVKELASLKTTRNAIPKVSGGGTEITLDKTAEATFEKFGLMGNCVQDGEPTPDTPQDIHVVSGDNEIKVENKNLFNYDDLVNKIERFTINGTANSFTLNGYGIYQYPFSAKGQLIFSLKWSSSNLNGDVKVVYEDGTDENIFGSYTGSSASGNVVFHSNSSKNIKAIQFRTYVTSDLIINDLQVEKGTQATSYEPHKEQIKHITLPNGMELAGIGDYKDVLFKNVPTSKYYNSSLDEGVWYKYNKLIKLKMSDIYNKFDNVTQYQNSLNSDNGIISLRMSKSYFSSLNLLESFAYGVSNGFIKSSVARWNNVLGLYKFWYTDGLIFDVLYTDLELNEWKANYDHAILREAINRYLGDIVFYLPAATPTYEPITDTTLISQLDDIYYTMQSYKGQTNISQTPNDAPFVLDITALKDIDLLLEDITNAILELGGE